MRFLNIGKKNATVWSLKHKKGGCNGKKGHSVQKKQRDTALEKVTSQRRELYKVKTELDDEKQKSTETDGTD